MAESRDAKKIQAMVFLPMEILSNILAELPVKDLIRFKSVCKSWYALISSSHFADLHSHRRLNYLFSDDRILIAPGEDGCLYVFNIDSLESPITKKLNLQGYSFKNIANSCNGLLLCICDDDPQNPSLILVNPSTLNHKRIPKIELPPNHSAVEFGFGYDSRANDYKIMMRIVELINDREAGCGDIMVYSFKSDSWKLIPAKFPLLVLNYLNFPWNGGLINNHLLHWLFWDRGLWSFDVCSEQWVEVPLPDDTYYGLGRTNIPGGLGVLDGCLCMMTYDTQLNEWSVLMMKEYGVKESWVKLLDGFDLEIIATEVAFTFPVVYSKSGSEILMISTVRKCSSFCWYNPTQKTTREAKIQGVSDPSARMSVCVRSLVPLPGSDEVS